MHTRERYWAGGPHSWEENGIHGRTTPFPARVTGPIPQSLNPLISFLPGMTEHWISELKSAFAVSADSHVHAFKTAKGPTWARTMCSEVTTGRPGMSSSLHAPLGPFTT